MSIEDEKIIEEIRALFKISADLKKAIIHKVEELKLLYHDDIEQYHQIVRLVDRPVECEFEMIRKKGIWKIKLENPGLKIPGLVNFIEALEKKAALPYFGNVDLPGGRMVLACDLVSNNCITGSITSGKRGKEKEKGLDSIECEADLKDFLRYLLNNQFLREYVLREFKTKWKQVIDGGLTQSN